MTPYQQYLLKKKLAHVPCGFKVKNVSKVLFPFQQVLVKNALELGRSAIFASCGLGKSVQQLEWARQVNKKTSGKVLILAPLSVAEQIQREAKKLLKMDIALARNESELGDISVTNYEKLHKFPSAEFAGVACDESSCLKSQDSATRNALIERFADTQFKLACTATPSPNDHVELGNHAQFLNVMSREEMLSMFFIHDGGDTSQWRLKKHAVKDFWRWVSSWATMIRHPRDLGFEQEGYDLPPLKIEHITVEAESQLEQDTLFPMPASSLQERLQARKHTIDQRIEACRDLVSAGISEKWVIWCKLNAEQDAIKKMLGSRAVSIQGSTPDDDKISMEREWREGGVPVMISKVELFGWGMNWQHCSNVVFLGLNDSYEAFHQAICRSHRFGQLNPVNVYVITSNIEGAVKENILRKKRQADEMAAMMVQYLRK